MRIVQVGPYPRDPECLKGGVEASLYGLSRALAKKHTVLALDIPKPGGRDETREREGVTVQHFRAPLALKISGLWRLPVYLSALRRWQPDVVHLQGSEFIVYALALLLRRSFIYTVHGIAAVEAANKYRKNPTLKNRLQKWLYPALEARTMRRAARLVVDTPYVTRMLPPSLARRATAIPQGIFKEDYQPTRGGGSQTIVSLGVFAERKSHHLLIEAFTRVREAVPEARLIIMGARSNPGYFAEVARLAAKVPGVELHVNLPREQVLATLQTARLFALHSQEESQGIALVEAMATGLPVVATTVGGIPDVVSHEQNGLLSAYGDTAAFAAHLIRLLEDNTLSAAFSAAARTAAAHYDWDALAARVVGEVYQGK